MKKSTAILLIIAMLFTMFPLMSLGTAAEAEETAATVPEDAVVISDVSDLEKLTNDGYYALANDIDFGGQTIASAYEIGDIALNGNGHSFLNFKLESSGNTLGLFQFGSGKTAASFCNVNFGSAEKAGYIEVNYTKDSSITAGSGGVGVIMGNTTDANTSIELKNINVYANITAAERTPIGGLIGSAIASNGTVTVENCSVYGLIKGNSTKAADVGYGGFFGRVHTGVYLTMTNCSNFASIAANGTGNTHKASGFIGSMGAPSLHMTDCVNYGTIETTALNAGGFIGQFYTGSGTAAVNYQFSNCINYGYISAVQYVGGMVGQINKGTNAAMSGTIAFESCKNYGTVMQIGATADSPAGGFIGRYSATVTVEVTNCANFGSIKGNGGNKAGFCGSLGVGGNNTFTAVGFFNFGDIESATRAGGVLGYIGGGKSYTFESCVNLGKLTGDQTGVGGIAASGAANTVINNCLSACSFSDNSVNNFGILVGSGRLNVTGKDNYVMVANTEQGKIHTHIEGDDGSTAADASYPLTGTTKLTAWAEVRSTLNETYSAPFGKFILTTDSNGVVLATPKLAGIQEALDRTGTTTSIRLVSVLQNSLAYEKVGFMISVNGGAVHEISCKHVYDKLLASNNGGNQTAVSASDLGGRYIYALTVSEIPTDQIITLTVTPFALDVNDTASTYLGSAYTVTIVNGTVTHYSAVSETAENG